MTKFDILHEAIPYAETESHIERLDEIVDALAAQALGRSQILAEQYGLEIAYASYEDDDDGVTVVRSNN
ncbi:MAG: hypothetical protein WAQ27_00655 [Candidatus Microsaccharimonas sp.]